MRILHMVPTFELGGVERYVIELAKEQVAHGHQVSLVTAGGKMEAQLPREVEVIHLPVQRKNLFTGLYCVYRLAQKHRQWDIVHAHSRVPAWIIWWTSALTGIPWIYTAHSTYSLNAGLTPLKHARGVICVSDAVRQHLADYLPENTVTMTNGMRKPSCSWEGRGFPGNPRFLFVGRLSRPKGLDTALRALGELKDRPWTLDVVGDGPQRGEWETLTAELGLQERVTFHGFRDDTEAWMARSGCLLFTSHQEGMPLTVNEALGVGIPILASDIEQLRPLASGPLVPSGDVEAWRGAIEKVLDCGTASPLSAEGLTTFGETAERIEAFYRDVLGKTGETTTPRPVLHLQKLIGRGGTRECWQHPLDDNLCVKVNLEHRKNNSLLYEIRVYERIKNLLPGLIPVMYPDLVETDKGQGLVSELVRDDDGTISPSLRDCFERGDDMKEILNPLNRIIKRLIVRDIFFFDLNKGNFAVQTVHGKKTVVMTDIKSLNRAGFKGFLHLERIFAPLARNIMFRRIRRLYTDLGLDFPFDELCRKKRFHTVFVTN